MDIYLIRHGQSTGNGLGCFLGWSDHPLTEVGRAQADVVASRLAPLGPMPIICSDLTRARETAETIAARWQGSVTADARWREISCGRFEGLAWNEFSKDEALTRQFDLDPYGTPMPGGESVAGMAARVTDAFEDICRLNEERMVIVAHDGPIRAVLAHCLAIPPERFWVLTTTHGGISLLGKTDGWLSVRTVNDTSHLAGIMLPVSSPSNFRP